MSLPGKTMKIGVYNYHVSDQGEGDKVAFLVHGMPGDGSCWKYQAPALHPEEDNVWVFGRRARLSF